MNRIVIVGAGVIGLFCATRLARGGFRVTLLEGENEDFTPYAPTASLAAAGLLAPLGEAEGVAHPEFERLALASFDLWRAQAPEALWRDGVNFDGAAMVRPSAEAAAACIEKAQAHGRAARLLTHRQWRKRTGLDARVAHAVFVEDEAVADPVRVLSGLCMEARRLGALLRFGEDVESVTATSVRTTGGETIETDHVLLAPGIWANDALREAAPALKRLRSAKGQIVPVALARPLGAAIHTPDFYLARRLTDDVVLGATMELDRLDRAVDPERTAELLAAAERVFPGEITARGRAWAGVRPMSPDGGPMIGRSGEVLVACGHSRNGWLLAPITAEIICAHLLGEALPPLWGAFAPDRFD